MSLTFTRTQESDHVHKVFEEISVNLFPAISTKMFYKSKEGFQKEVSSLNPLCF